MKLVGLLPENVDEVIPEGAYITVLNAGPDEQGKTPHTGFVTSSYYSPMLGLAFARALVAGGLDRMAFCPVSLPCHGPKLFRFALVEGAGRRGCGVGINFSALIRPYLGFPAAWIRLPPGFQRASGRLQIHLWNANGRLIEGFR
ncbi:glycine cleavage T C-terminal barrel domain-containing protein [Flavihumibacter profundi]|uniref:glycine cleavage T C-terminal barrel domain-containing protein n=1 Tax=Flavihumibacter profundi TaxID=2716883 RepID=UPI001CC5A414|nr:hypothetical protein [Flavihumibacter profundi]